MEENFPNDVYLRNEELTAADAVCDDTPCRRTCRIIEPPPRVLSSPPIEGVGVGAGIVLVDAISESPSNSLRTLSRVGSAPIGGIEYSTSSN